MVLSVYVPMVLLAYMAIFLTLSVLVSGVGHVGGALHRHGPQGRPARGVRLSLEPGRA